MKRIKGWEGITLNIAKQLDTVSGDMITQDVKIVSILHQLSEDEVWNKPLEDVNLLTREIKWIYDEMPEGELNEITYKGVTFKPRLTPSAMTFSQYVDVQNYIKDVNRYRGELIATLFVPENGKYGVGYDISEFTGYVYDTVTLPQFKGFFLSSLECLRTLIPTSMKLLRKRNPKIWKEMKTLLCGLGL